MALLNPVQCFSCSGVICSSALIRSMFLSLSATICSAVSGCSSASCTGLPFAPLAVLAALAASLGDVPGWAPCTGPRTLLLLLAGTPSTPVNTPTTPPIAPPNTPPTGPAALLPALAPCSTPLTSPWAWIAGVVASSITAAAASAKRHLEVVRSAVVGRIIRASPCSFAFCGGVLRRRNGQIAACRETLSFSRPASLPDHVTQHRIGSGPCQEAPAK